MYVRSLDIGGDIGEYVRSLDIGRDIGEVMRQVLITQ